MSSGGLICELHRLVCEDVWIPINDPKGGITGFAKAGEYRTTPSSAPSLLHQTSSTHFLPQNEISSRMQELAQIINSVFSSSVPRKKVVEKIVMFTTEFLTVHPFANQNGRIAQVLMELFAYHADLEPFYISYVCKKDYPQICKSCEEVIAQQSTKPFVKVINSFFEKSEAEYLIYSKDAK